MNFLTKLQLIYLKHITLNYIEYQHLCLNIHIENENPCHPPHLGPLWDVPRGLGGVQGVLRESLDWRIPVRLRQGAKAKHAFHVT